jgi:hydroxypyruvate isomerase
MTTSRRPPEPASRRSTAISTATRAWRIADWLLDLSHAQIGEGNLIELCRQALPYIGEIQVADVRGRCEPGTGEINDPAVAAAPAQMGYRGTVGLEGWASGDPTAAVERFRVALDVR